MSKSIPLTKALRFLQELRRLTPEMSALEAHILLVVARSPGISQTEVAIEMRLSKSAVSRYVDMLGGREGRGFLTVREAIEDRRFSELRLTVAGEAFLAGLAGFL